MKSTGNRRNRCRFDRLIGIFLLVAFCLASAGTASAQKKKKNQDDSQPTPPPAVAAAAPDEQKIDFVIGEWLGAWQVGDVESFTRILRTIFLSLQGRGLLRQSVGRTIWPPTKHNERVCSRCAWIAATH